jgi:DNA repair exonuclease SbcCD ATPase subunit
MIIKKAVIKGFGKYSQKEFLFDRGLNCVFGENEAGKSTLLWFIRGMLYGLKGGRAKTTGEQAPLKKFQPWSDNTYSGSLEIETDKGETFYIYRDFNKKTLNIYNDRYEDVTSFLLTSSDMQPGEIFTGMSEECFESTCFIDSAGSCLTIDDRKGIESRLIEVSETGFFDVSLTHALSLLEDIRKKEIGAAADRRTLRDRPLPKTLDRITELEEKTARFEKIREEITSLHERLDQVQIQIKEYEGTIALLNREEEVLDEAASLLKDLIKVSILNDMMESYKENVKALEKAKTKKTECQNALSELSVYEGETAESVKIPGQLYDRKRLYRSDYEKALRALEQYKEEKTLLEKQLKEYEAFLDNKGAVDTVLDLQRILPVYKKDAEQSAAKRKEERKAEQEVIAKKIKRTNLLFIPILLAFVIFGMFSYIEQNIIGALLLVPCVAAFVLLFLKKKSMQKEIYHEGDDQARITPEMERYQEAESRLAQALKLLSCSDFDEFKRRLNDFNALVHKTDAITYGERLQNEAVQEKHDWLTRAESEFKEAIAKFKREEAEDKEKIAAIERGWNRYVGIKMELEQWERREKELSEALSALLMKLKDQGYSDFDELYRAYPSLTESLQKKAAYVKEKAQGLESPELDRGISLLSKQDIKAVGSLFETLSQENKRKREQVIPAHGDLKVTETRIQRDLDNLWEEYEDYKSASEELLMLYEKKERLMLQDRILNETISMLRMAGDDVKNNFYRPMSEKLNMYVSLITSGKHGDMKVGETLQINASGESGIRSVMDYSTGTIEQIFFALRLACAELMEGEETCPLFADEIFASYDDQRVFRTLRLIAETATKRQVFLFTCRKREPDMIVQVLPNVPVILL